MITWKDKLGDRVPADWGQEIDSFEAQIALRKQGKIEEKVFAETRLRRGAYGQRYDNGQRHDGLKTQKIPYGPLTKGPDTFWEAPGMQRIKIPYGGVNPEQMIVLAELAEEYSDAICHITTRQDIQLHFVVIEDTPDIFRRLAAVGITSREACGNSVRNVTACPLAGVCNTEAFDVTPYAKATAFYLLGHRDVQDFGRKFKIAFSGCEDEACALVSLHDLGGIAATKVVNGKTVRGFKIYVGGGLGAVPYQAKLLDEFVPEEELLPLSRAIGRVFARLGEKRNRNRARLKFLVQKLGIDEFRRLVIEERQTMPDDPAWREHFNRIPRYEEKPLLQAVQLNGARRPAGYDEWANTNLYQQRQSGYYVATVTCPLGDLTSNQMRALAHIAARYAGGNARTTVEQNIVLRWIPHDKTIDLYKELSAIGLGEAGAGTIVDVVACPGTDTCKLGIASSRGLAGELRHRLAAKSASLDQAIRGLRIKVSGCFNSCGQHHAADIGFYGNSRNINGYTVPHFQVMLGGQWTHNAGSYALAMGSVPSRRIPDLIERLTQRYVAERTGEESFQKYCQRIGKQELKNIVNEFVAVPTHKDDPSFYSDWGDPREFTIGDMGVGECAGEIVSLAQFGFTLAESEAFEAQLLLDAGQFRLSDEKAYQAMLTAAKTLVQLQWADAPNDANLIVEEFRTRFVEPKLFWDTYHHGQFANYLFARHEGADSRYTQDTAHKLVEEANLFIDAAHKCHAKVQAAGATAAQPAAAK
ncbi:MAG TPA: nitrite/sulfite reductase [Tepidisphaeraceae bacterium]|jgi:sulfite reductase (ferredoxin)|nr:nitrite/sulfite reductase [Tepidisphaeraceae bacterium]